MCCLPMYSFAHPGRTDSNGGHTDKSTGEYHYHHGYPAHDHWDIDGDGTIDCPYNFDDQTNHNSGNNNGIGSETNTQKKPHDDATQQNKRNDKVYTYIAIGFIVAFFILVNCLAIHIDKTDKSKGDEPVSLPSVFISVFSTIIVFALLFYFVCLYKQPLILGAISFKEMLQVLFLFAPISALVVWTAANSVSGIVSTLLCWLFKVEVYGWNGCFQRLAIPFSYAVIVLMFILE